MFIHFFHHQTLKLYNICERVRPRKELVRRMRHALRWATFLATDCLIIPTSDLVQSPIIEDFRADLDLLVSVEKAYFVGSSTDHEILQDQHIQHFGATILQHQRQQTPLERRLKRFQKGFRMRRLPTTTDIQERWGQDLRQLERDSGISERFSTALLREAQRHLKSTVSPAQFERALASLPDRLEQRAFLWDIIEMFKLLDFRTTPYARERFNLALAWDWVKGYISEYGAPIIGRVPQIGYIDFGISRTDPGFFVDLVRRDVALELLSLTKAFQALTLGDILDLVKEPRVILLRNLLINPLSSLGPQIGSADPTYVPLLLMAQNVREQATLAANPRDAFQRAAEIVLRSTEGGISLNVSKPKFDFAIITIREDEYKAVLNKFPLSPHAPFYEGRNRTYAVSDLLTATGMRYQVAIAASLEQGPLAAQELTRDMIEDLQPRWLVLVGIAGAVPDTEFTLGDVVVAKRLHDFTVGAVKEGESRETSNQGGALPKRVQDLLALLPALEQELSGWNERDSIGLPVPAVDVIDENFYGSKAWVIQTKKALASVVANGRIGRQPIVTARSIGSSGDLIKDTKTLSQWKKSAREIAAVEMELSGVYVAARHKDGQYPILAIRGISDIVGFKRGAEWTSYACKTAAAFAHKLLASGRV